MTYLGEFSRVIHVLFGTIGLAAFWIPVFTKKGAVNHVRFGKIFVWSAYVVLGAAALALAARSIEMWQQGRGYAEAPLLVAFMVFLGYLTFVTFVIVRHGMQVLRSKANPDSISTPLNKALAFSSIAASAGIILFALILNPANKILLFALSPIGIGTGYGMLKYLAGARRSPRAWLYEHLGAMLGAGIAFHTAFAVFGITRMFDVGLTGWAAVIPWIAPTVIGLPAITIWTKHYQRKYREIA